MELKIRNLKETDLNTRNKKLKKNEIKIESWD
jgi:hypothetical protein